MKLITGLILVLIFLILSILHFYWGFGGKWGLSSSVPSKENGERVLEPKIAYSLIVGAGLFALGVFVLIKGGFLNILLPGWLFDFGLYFIAAIFISRALGDFRYIGFFRKIKNTLFAKLDSRYFTPLCLLTGALCLILQYMK